MPEYPELCWVVDALGSVESDIEYVKANPQLYRWNGIVEVNGNLIHVYHFTG